VLDIQELIRYVQAGESDRQIEQALHIGRKTVGKYRAWALRHGLKEGPLPSPETLQQWLDQDCPDSPPPKTVSTVEPYRAVVIALRERGVEVATIFQRLKEDYAYPGTYSSVYRFVRQLEPQTPEVTIRIERPPGEEAQVDFGYAGKMIDGQGDSRRAWAFVMTLSYSRHMYVEFVFDQTVETWLLLHQHAFEAFGGVPRKVVLDNLKAGIVKACREDPQVQRAYREFAAYHGFLIAPCPPREPQQKGKVESGVHYVTRSFLAGRDPAPLIDQNVKVRIWVEQVAGQRIHGTTRWQPLAQFERVERGGLLPLPLVPFEVATWKQVKLHRDCYVQFDHAYYSAPFQHVGQLLWVRGDTRTVRLYAEYALIATHSRATQPGQRITHLAHLPPDKIMALTETPDYCRSLALQIGTATASVVHHLLEERPLDQLRSVRKLVHLADTYTPARLEQACTRALRFDTATYVAVKHILQAGLDIPSQGIAVTGWPQFARTPQDLLGHLAGGG
jgi:transposase